MPNARAITVRHLMTHTSGVMPYEFKTAFPRDLIAHPEKHRRPEELLAYVLDEAPSFAAGDGWEYSDTNYILLGMIRLSSRRSPGGPATTSFGNGSWSPWDWTIPSHRSQGPSLA